MQSIVGASVNSNAMDVQAHAEQLVWCSWCGAAGAAPLVRGEWCGLNHVEYDVFPYVLKYQHALVHMI